MQLCAKAHRQPAQIAPKLRMRPFCVLLEPRRMRGNQWENVHANQHAMQILLPCYVIQLQCM